MSVCAPRTPCMSKSKTASKSRSKSDVQAVVVPCDFCIIGGGISGLTFAKQAVEKLTRRRRRPPTCVVLEKDGYDVDGGGRLRMAEVNGVDIVQGAGVARQDKDTLLLNLADELGLTDRVVVPANITYSSRFGMSHERVVRFIKDSVLTMTQAARTAADDPDRSNPREKGKGGRSREFQMYRSYTTFWTFMNDVLGDDRAQLLSRLLGYTDYLDADFVDTLDDYGLEDNFTADADDPARIEKMPWGDLMNALKEKVRRQGTEIRHRAEVVGIDMYRDMLQTPSPPLFTVKYKKYDVDDTSVTYHEVVARHVVIATTVRPMLDILKTVRPPGQGPTDPVPRELEKLKQAVSSQLGSQPFLRLYAHVDTSTVPGKEFASLIKATVVVPNALHKIIPIDPTKGVYMVAYCDNADAVSLRPWLDDTPGNRAKIGRLVAEALGMRRPPSLKRMCAFFWEEGTHFFRPLSTSTFRDREEFLRFTLRPIQGLTLLGEGLSRNQGWTQGALERVRDAVHEL